MTRTITYQTVKMLRKIAIIPITAPIQVNLSNQNLTHASFILMFIPVL